MGKVPTVGSFLWTPWGRACAKLGGTENGPLQLWGCVCVILIRGSQCDSSFSTEPGVPEGGWDPKNVALRKLTYLGNWTLLFSTTIKKADPNASPSLATPMNTPHKNTQINFVNTCQKSSPHWPPSEVVFSGRPGLIAPSYPLPDQLFALTQVLAVATVILDDL